MADIVTVNPDELGEAAAATDAMAAVVFAPGGPLQKLPFDKLLAKLIATNLCKASLADLVADLAHDADAVALVFNDPTAVQNGWYRKSGASGAGAWVQFETLSVTARTVAEAAMRRAQLAVPFVSWAVLSEATGMVAGDRAQVFSVDSGTHIDPVSGEEVKNAGVYGYSAEPAGWQRLADLDSQIARDVRFVTDYGERASIPMSERFIGLTVFVISDQRWFDLPTSDFSNETGWKTPSWFRPITQGTIAQRNNRVGISRADVPEGTRFLQTDVVPNVLWEFRYIGSPSGPLPTSTAMTEDTWVSIPQASDFVALSIAGFEAKASSSDVNPPVTLRWSILGTQPDTQTISWGATSIKIPGSARSYNTKDWAAPKPLFIASNSLGDSTDAMDRWSRLLAARRGVALYSVARYSSDWRQVYRAGVEPIYLTVRGGVVPAGGISESITLINGIAPSGDPGVNPASFLNVGDAGILTGLSMAGTIVDGANTRHVTVSIPNGNSTAYSIVADAGSAALALSGAVRFIPDIAAHMASSDVIIWIGNNYEYSGVANFYGDYTNPQMWVDMAKLVAGAQGNRVLILPVLPSAHEPVDGTPNPYVPGENYHLQASRAAANARTESLYPNLYARALDGRDLLQYLQDHGDGSANDNSDIANGWTPRSLRRDDPSAPDGKDLLHLNSAGDAVVADFVEEAMARQALPDPVTQETVFALSASGTITYQVLYETETTTTTDVAVATVSRAAAGIDEQARANIIEIQALLGELEMAISGPTYSASTIVLTADQAAGTSPILAANANRRGLIIKPPAACTISFHSGEAEGIVSGLAFERTGPGCPKNAIYVRGLGTGANVRIEEGV